MVYYSSGGVQYVLSLTEGATVVGGGCQTRAKRRYCSWWRIRGTRQAIAWHQRYSEGTMKQSGTILWMHIVVFAKRIVLREIEARKAERAPLEAQSTGSRVSFVFVSQRVHW